MKTIPLMGNSFFASNIHVETWKTLQNINLDMQEILGIDKALQVSNYTTKLIEIKKRVKEIARI